jgi:hypothetical protein
VAGELGQAETDTEAETAETETARYPRVQKIQQITNPGEPFQAVRPVEETVRRHLAGY